MKEYKFTNKLRNAIITVVAPDIKYAESILFKCVNNKKGWVLYEPKPGRLIINTTTSSTIQIS